MCHESQSYRWQWKGLHQNPKMMEETDFLGISALSLECAMSTALRGEGWGGMEMFLLPCVEHFGEDTQLGARWVFHKACWFLWGLVLA